MSLHRNFVLSIATIAAASMLGGCEAFFGVNDGPVDDYPVFEDDWETPDGTGQFQVIGVSPSTASIGEQVDIYAVSSADTATDQFGNDDFWYCFFDGQSAMVETGGDDYDPDVPVSEVLADPELGVGLTAADLEGLTISTTTVTVPAGSFSGDALIITPGGNEYFDLTVR
jgi:hypothetical protein